MKSLTSGTILPGLGPVIFTEPRPRVLNPPPLTAESFPRFTLVEGVLTVDVVDSFGSRMPNFSRRLFGFLFSRKLARITRFSASGSLTVLVDPGIVIDPPPPPPPPALAARPDGLDNPVGLEPPRIVLI